MCQVWELLQLHMIDVEVGELTTKHRAQNMDIKYVLCSAGTVSLTSCFLF